MELGKFYVHRNSPHKAPMVKTIDGEEMMVDVSTQEIELTPVDGDHGTLTLRFFKNADRLAMSDLAAQGGYVTLSIEKAEGDSPAEELPPAA